MIKRLNKVPYEGLKPKLLEDRVKDMSENPGHSQNFSLLDCAEHCSLRCENLCGMMRVTDLKMKFARMLLEK